MFVEEYSSPAERRILCFPHVSRPQHSHTFVRQAARSERRSWLLDQECQVYRGLPHSNSQYALSARIGNSCLAPDLQKRTGCDNRRADQHEGIKLRQSPLSAPPTRLRKPSELYVSALRAGRLQAAGRARGFHWQEQFVVFPKETCVNSPHTRLDFNQGVFRNLQLSPLRKQMLICPDTETAVHSTHHQGSVPTGGAIDKDIDWSS